MSSWMKRRISRSRTRCHRAPSENNKKRRAEKKEEKHKQEAAPRLPADSHLASDK